MKLFIFAVLFVGIGKALFNSLVLNLIIFDFAALARPEEFHETEEEFEEEFGILDSDPEEKKTEAENLKKAEDEINENNKKFENGESTFEEQLYEESDLPKEEFEKEKEGATMPDDVRTAFVGDRIMGVYMPPESVRNDPVNAAKLKKLYAELEQNRAGEPDSYDAKALGNFWNIKCCSTAYCHWLQPFLNSGIVTVARNQMSCGSCAAFAAVGLHETCMLKAGAKKDGLDLSEQYLVDCGFNAE